MNFNQEQLINKWERFFETRKKIPIIQEIADAFPERKPLHIDYWDIDKFDVAFAEYLLNKPHNSIYTAEQAALNLTPPDMVEKGVKPRVQIIRLPDENNVKVSKIRAEHIGKFVAIGGVIRKLTEVRPMLNLAIFQCLRCYALIKIQQESTVFNEPTECLKEHGGCGRAAASTAFKLLTDESLFLDAQRVELLESPEGLGRRKPESLTVMLNENLAGILEPGDRLIINGAIHSQQRISSSRGKSNIFDIYLDANSFEMKERGYEDVEISKLEETRIKKLAKNPKIYDMLIDAFAPTIYGLETEKLVIIFLLISGISKHMPDETRIRGLINVLLVGDPSTAKTKLIKIAEKTAPVSVYVSGKKASGPGIGAAVVKDQEFGGGRWVLEPGAAVLADGGVLCMDEIDKMKKDAEDELLEIMENNEVSVAKAGIVSSLKARCSVLAGANPKYGRFDEYRPVSDQIDMPPALLSRFDIIFPIKDKVNKDTDTELSAHVLRAHRAGQMAKNVQEIGTEFYSDDEVTEHMKEFKKPMNRDFIRKYISYVRQYCFPVLTIESLDELRNYYVTLRTKTSMVSGTVAITVRQLEGLIRLSESCARSRLSNKIEHCDIERVIAICEYFLKAVASDGGVFDIDMIATGVSHTQRERINILTEAIRAECGISKSGAAYRGDIKRALESKDYDIDIFDQDMEKMQTEGRIFFPKDGIVRLVKP